MKEEVIKTLGVVGAGAMGSGIAQVAAIAGWNVLIYDHSQEAVSRGIEKIRSILDRLVIKGRMTEQVKEEVLSRIKPVDMLSDFSTARMVVEAIVENMEVKKGVFKELESVTSNDCILASNTSSLSITSIASAVEDPSKVIGLHFFNPPGLMKLVEIIPGYLTDIHVVDHCKNIVSEWGKVGTVARDTPGFIVNKIARPFYSEAIRIAEEGIATPPEIDWVMKVKGGFRMGPFTLMDYIGHDVNYAVTSSVWQAFYYDSRYKPSLMQKKLLEAGLLGKKTGRGFYRYEDGVMKSDIKEVKEEKATLILNRILAMLINEAADTVYYGICSEEDADLAMTKGVNYPMGLMAWGNQIGWSEVAAMLNELYEKYREERYRTSIYIQNKLNDAGS